ncbi:MAG TPA: sugar phosphate nucleotidyltransferase, partial [Planctomycetota bacterium]|nr:sugar phosphate nucleotidyltransferase [Planctomycetota bacterium]
GFVTFGIRPTYPATGYGYIHGGETLEEIDGIAVRRVRAFREKPDAATAARFLATGEFLWNSGIFVWRARTLVDAIAKHEPAIGAALAKLAPSVGTSSEAGALEEAYASIPSVSVDVGVLERAPNVRVIDVSFQWSDVGSWDALDDLLRADGDGHRVVAPDPSDVIGVSSARCLVQSTERHVIALVGVEDLVVVHTPDATLICRRGQAEDVKKVVERLAQERREDLL